MIPNIINKGNVLMGIKLVAMVTVSVAGFAQQIAGDKIRDNLMEEKIREMVAEELAKRES